MKSPSRIRLIAFVLTLIIINALAFSFTLVDKGSYKNALYYRFTRQRFAWIVSALPPKYAIQAGWAKVTITPSVKTSMAGAGPVQNWTTVLDSIYVRAVVLDNGTTLAAIITIDLLIMPPTVAQELQKQLPKLGFDWKNVYLGSTYSHHSLGGWANDYMGKKTVGDYDERLVAQLTKNILDAVAVAKKNKSAVQIGYSPVNTDSLATSEDARNSPEKFHFLKLRKLTGESALICSPEGGQLVISPSTSSALSRDFSGVFTDKLEKQTGSFALFMVGPVGLTERTISLKNAASHVDSLLLTIAPVITRMPLHTDSTLVAQAAPLIQSDPQVRVSKNWRLKPWLVKALYGDYPAELKALRIGKTVFVGTPGAFSDQLLPSLSITPAAKRNNLILTSFNGGNIGQIVPDSAYYSVQNPYDIAEMNRFGPHTGAFFEDMVQSLVGSLK